jgi:hypothetical protein
LPRYVTYRLLATIVIINNPFSFEQLCDSLRNKDNKNERYDGPLSNGSKKRKTMSRKRQQDQSEQGNDKYNVQQWAKALLEQCDNALASLVLPASTVVTSDASELAMVTGSPGNHSNVVCVEQHIPAVVNIDKIKCYLFTIGALVQVRLNESR